MGQSFLYQSKIKRISKFQFEGGYTSVKEENAYEPTYITHGLPVEMDVEKGAWFKVGVNMRNNTDADKIVYVEVEGVEVRIK